MPKGIELWALSFRMALEKAIVYIDGGYLSKIMKSQFNNQRIDFLKLSECLCKKNNVSRLRTYYYNCLPIARAENPKDAGKVEAMQKFLTKLKRLPRFEVRLGKLQLVGTAFRQKMVDVLMSLDIATLCYEANIQHTIVIAGDSDFVPAIQKAKARGNIVHLYYHPCSVHNQILDEVDEIHEIDKSLIDLCKQDI